MFSYKTSAFAALVGISLAVIPPVVRSATIDVTVGGPNGTVAYAPEYVVRLPIYSICIFTDFFFPERKYRRCRPIHIRAEKSHCDPIFLCFSLFTTCQWL